MSAAQRLVRAIFVAASIFFLQPVALAAHHCTPKLLERAGRIAWTDASSALAHVAPGRSVSDVRDVAALPDQLFVPLSRATIAAPAGHSTWIRLCLQRTESAPTDWVLAILPAYVHRIVLHEPHGTGFRARVRDRALGIDDSDYSYRGAAFRLTPDSDAASFYYVEIVPARPITVDFLLFDSATLSHFIALEYGGFGLYLGMMLLVGIINLIFWHRLRDRVHLYYATAILSIAMFAIMVGGYIQQFVPQFHKVYIQAFFITSVLSSVLFTRFVLEAFRTRLYYRRLRRVGNALIVAFIALGVLGVLGIDPGFDVQRASRYLTGVGLVTFGLMSVHAMLWHRSVRLYAIALMPLTLGLLSIASNRLGMTELPMADHLPNLGALVHLILLNFVLVRRAERAERRQKRATLSALRTAQASERMLENRVHERTRELDTTNARLRHEVEERTSAQSRLHEALAAERRALHSQRQFVAMLSHELRTPLAVIDTAAQGIEAEAPVPSSLQQRVDRIRRSVARLITFIENLLAEERIDSPMSIRMRGHDLAAALRERYPALAGRRVRPHLPSGPVELTCDPDLIGIVISNLVDNALKYSPDDSPVELVLECDDALVRVEVRDRGPGIAPEEAERVFERYYRSQNGSNGRGIGLGLYLCREIARRHGGEIALSSPDHGEGARMTLRLPRNPPDSAT